MFDTIRPLLLALGQKPIISDMTSIYLKILTPGLWSYSINWTLTAWLQAIEMADVPAYDRFYQRLIARVPIADVSASFVMEDIKETTALPV